MKAKAKRLIDIEKALVSGMAYGEVQRTFCAKTGVCDRVIRKDIETVKARWAKDAESEGKADVRRNQIRRFLYSVAHKALKAKKFNAAVAAANRIMELDGLKTIKVEHSGEVETKITMSDDEVDDRIAVLQKAIENSEEHTRH